MVSERVWASPPIGAAGLSGNGPAPVVLSQTGQDLPLIIRGSAGLIDRPRVRPVSDDLIEPVGEDEQGQPIYAQEPAPGRSLPGSCLRVLSSPRAVCSGDCPGLMRDGSCLADVASANPGCEFMIDPEGFWALKSDLGG